MKKTLGATDTFFPVPAALVAGGTMAEHNVITVAWIGIVSSSPPTVGISLRKTRHSLGIIRQCGEFTVNIPPARLFAEVDYCGLVSGRDVDKFEAAGLTPTESSVVAAPIIDECPYNMECRVTGEHEIGEWVLLLGEIVETHADAEVVGADSRIDIAKLNPLVYCAAIREYWELGRKLGDGFNAGRSIHQ
ncbi:MAG TPA: flavin reductase family protein [Candidatus Anoxymicrobiaceae bacterium]|jgi:flavin reductase (DIM6/NTAB) family NADH-FMN oxidoreductase RutF